MSPAYNLGEYST